MPYYLRAAEFYIVAHYANEFHIPTSPDLSVSELSERLIVLLPLLHWKQSLHTLLHWHVFCSLSVLALLSPVCHVVCMLCPFEFLPET